MDYARARWLGVRTELMPRLRRFALGLLFALCLAAALAGNWQLFVPVLLALASWSVVPLLQAPWPAAATLLTLWVAWQWLWFPWLLPARWLELERHWPVASRQRWWSDLQMTVLVQSPWALLQATGLLALQPGLGVAVLCLLLQGLAVSAGIIGLQLRRRRPASVLALRRGARASIGASLASALLLDPLLRGRWPRSRRVLLGASSLLLLLPMLSVARLSMVLWVLACCAAVPRLAALLREESARHWQDLAALPLRPRRWAQALQGLALMPPLLGLLAWAGSGATWRVAVLAAFVSAVLMATACWAWLPVQSDKDAWVRGVGMSVLLVVLGTESLR